MPSRTILLVEDNPRDIDLITRALQKCTVANHLVVARDGQEALDYLFAEGSHADRDDSELPAIVLLDLNLPGLGGLEVLRRIREDPRTRRVCVAILTTSDERQDLGSGYDLKVNSYIRKPVDLQQFASAVEQLGLYWLSWNEQPSGPRSPK